MGPKTSLFLQIVIAAGAGGGLGFYIQHKLWSKEKEQKISELQTLIEEKRERINQLKSGKAKEEMKR